MSDYSASQWVIEKCCRMYEKKMMEVAMSILRDPILAAEAVQEGILQMEEEEAWFEDIHSEECERYVITVIKHASSRIYNQKRRESERLASIAQEPNNSRRDDTDSKVSEDINIVSLDSRQEDNALHVAIASLPYKYYEVADCILIKHMTNEETAKTLGISKEDVKKRIQLAEIVLKGLVKTEKKYAI